MPGSVKNCYLKEDGIVKRGEKNRKIGFDKSEYLIGKSLFIISLDTKIISWRE